MHVTIALPNCNQQCFVFLAPSHRHQLSNGPRNPSRIIVSKSLQDLLKAYSLIEQFLFSRTALGYMTSPGSVVSACDKSKE